MVFEIVWVIEEIGRLFGVFVVFFGMGGIIIGIGEVFKEIFLDIMVYVVEFVGLFVLFGGKFGVYKFVGMSSGFIFLILN